MLKGILKVQLKDGAWSESAWFNILWNYGGHEAAIWLDALSIESVISRDFASRGLMSAA